MEPNSFTQERGAVLLRLIACLLLVAVPAMLYAATPSWWDARGVTNGRIATDYGVANQGQVKSIAVAAVNEFDAHLPAGAGGTLHAMVAGWAASEAASGTTGTSESGNIQDYAAINLGQLKTVAKPFYDQLIRVGYAAQYPWASSSNAANDYAVANIGQVKGLFAFDLTSTAGTSDTDGNGLADWWEQYYFGHTGLNPSATAGVSGSGGITLLQAFEEGIAPSSAGPPAPVAAPLALWWRLDEGSGAAVWDASGHDDNGSISSSDSGAALWQEGFDGLNVLRFEGRDSASGTFTAITSNTAGGASGTVAFAPFPAMVSSSAAQPFTFSLWCMIYVPVVNDGADDYYDQDEGDNVYVDPPVPAMFAIAANDSADSSGATGTTGTVGFSGTAGSGFRLEVDNTTGTSRLVLSSTADGGNVSLSSSVIINASTWVHAAVTYDGTAARLYLNGTQEASQTGTILGNRNPLSIGSCIAGDYGFGGQLADVRVYSAALSGSQVAQLASRQSRARTLLMTGGDRQSGVIGTQLDYPLGVKVSAADGTPLANQFVIYTVMTGSGLGEVSLSGAAAGASSSGSLVTQTGSDGTAQANVSVGGTVSGTARVVASIPAQGGVPVTGTFTVYTEDGAALPPAPTEVNVTRNLVTGAETLTWASSDSNASLYVVSRLSDGVWQTIGAVPGGSFSYVDTTAVLGQVYAYSVAAHDGPTEFNTFSPLGDYGMSGGGSGGSGNSGGNNSPSSNPAMEDPDGDPHGSGMTNAERAAQGLTLSVADSDGDGIVDGSDGWALDATSKVPRIPETQYAVIDLQAYASGTITALTTINDLGEVLFTYSTPDGQGHTAYYSGVLDLRDGSVTYKERNYNYINNNGDFLPDSVPQYTSITASPFPNVSDSIFDDSPAEVCLGVKINDNGDIAETSYRYNDDPPIDAGGFEVGSTAICYAGGGKTLTGTGGYEWGWDPPAGALIVPGIFVYVDSYVWDAFGGGLSYPLDINNDDEVSGNGQIWSGGLQTFKPAEAITLNRSETHPAGISSGTIGGPSSNPIYASHLYQKVGSAWNMEPLKIYDADGISSVNATAINNRYEVVGTFTNKKNKTFQLVQNGHTVDLSQRCPGWSNFSNLVINNNGVIAASAVNATTGSTSFVALLPVQFSYNKEVLNPPTYNYIPASAVGVPKPDTDITLTALPSNGITISANPSGTFTASNGATDTFGNFKSTFTASTGTATENFKATIKSGTAISLPHHMLPAYYHSTFHITGYSTPSEVNFSGPKVTTTTQTSGRGRSRKLYNITSSVSAKSDFLGSVAIEGEGYLENGTHVVATNHTEKGSANPIIVDCVISTDHQKPQGTYAPLVDGQSCAVTLNGPIPPKAKIYIINDQDQREADDKVASNENGGLYHIDLYCGFNKQYADTLDETDDVVLESY